MGTDRRDSPMAVANPRRVRHFLRSASATAVVTLVGAGSLVLAVPADAATPVAASSTSAAVATAGSTPAYRHGEVRTLSGANAVGPTAHALAAAAASTTTMTYGGGIDDVGVVVGTPRVYLVYDGAQWGTEGAVTVGGRTVASFSGDPAGMAPVQQAFFAGLGTNGETWSGVATQYCQGIATGASVCPAGAAHTGHPTDGVLAGVWEDTRTTSPAAATPAQLALEAEAAAAHFGNTTQASNRNAQYVIVSPTGTHPDGFNTSSGSFCAWHDYTADPSIGSVAQPDGIIAFTNMPYLPDMGTSCGQNFVNKGSSGLLDGVTIVGGHEYNETLTDPFPGGGWTDSSGDEVADVCAWITAGQGGSADLALATGTFAVQAIWGNDANGGTGGCELSHPFVTSPANVVSLANPGTQTGSIGSPTRLTLAASDSASGQALSFSATGLPAGLSITPTGQITGTPTASGTTSVVVTVTDPTKAMATVSFSWTVAAVAHVIAVAEPGPQSTVRHAFVSQQIRATDPVTGSPLAYSATGLPAGLTINRSSGLITGKPSQAGVFTVTVSVTDTVLGSGSTSFRWTT